ncbi:TPA: glutathione transferase GstA [Legionella pneumophila]|uniref:Glutathione transferase GstA n=2 Tax=Legionella pneumophila TaxID=446 RepID=A0AAN5Q114_LEGPN|nr:glutathione transferase GstA [Legionella pneumophila]HAT8830845.1 glutathione transferase GstA [Legionella pneumophila subsp. pneumophila]HAT7003150.1 glutathione transferase GstA [Legionella pneumophila]HAT7741900.1 glutathione transferase GstA [Legionella pneumophila]HAT7937008.1 glutathione transferase GstA [Legionella pneumophila]
MNMKLYYCRGACSLVVRIILNELGLNFQDEEVDLKVKKTAGGEDFFKINPKGAVPTLVLDNGDVLTENQVILQYLADTTPGQKLLASVGESKRYHTLEWLNYISTELHKSLGMFFNPTVSEEIKSKILTPLVMTRFAYTNTRLAKGSYLMGNEFSLPDAYLFVMVSWAKYFKLDLSQFEHLTKFMDLMLARPSVAKSLQQEKL